MDDGFRNLFKPALGQISGDLREPASTAICPRIVKEVVAPRFNEPVFDQSLEHPQL